MNFDSFFLQLPGSCIPCTVKSERFAVHKRSRATPFCDKTILGQLRIVIRTVCVCACPRVHGYMSAHASTCSFGPRPNESKRLRLNSKVATCAQQRCVCHTPFFFFFFFWLWLPLSHLPAGQTQSNLLLVARQWSVLDSLEFRKLDSRLFLQRQRDSISFWWQQNVVRLDISFCSCACDVLQDWQKNVPRMRKTNKEVTEKGFVDATMEKRDSQQMFVFLLGTVQQSDSAKARKKCFAQSWDAT